MLERVDFNGNPHIGVYARANNDIVIIPQFLPSKIKYLLEKILNAKVIELSIGGSGIIGSLLAMNSHGAIVADFIEEHELDIIKKNFKGEILIIGDRFNAAGNNILVNDYGAIIHPMISDETAREIKKVLDVEIKKATIAGLNTTGMAAVATNNGVLCHPKIDEDERKMIEEIMGVKVLTGTVNHGIPYVGAGIIANDTGSVVGRNTTGIEMGRVEEALNVR